MGRRKPRGTRSSRCRLLRVAGHAARAALLARPQAAGGARLARRLLRRCGGARDASKVVVHPLLLRRELAGARPQRLGQGACKRAGGKEGRG
jgi:hypothetical protein